MTSSRNKNYNFCKSCIENHEASLWYTVVDVILKIQLVDDFEKIIFDNVIIVISTCNNNKIIAQGCCYCYSSICKSTMQ